MNGFQQFLGLSFRSKCFFLFVVVLLCVLRLILLIIPFRLYRLVVMRLLRRHGTKAIERHPVARRIIWTIETIGSFAPFTRHCLTRALVAKLLLDFFHFDVDFHIGVMRKENGKIEAHAWLESRGRVLLGSLSTLPGYTNLPLISGERG